MTWLQLKKDNVVGVVASDGAYITHAMDALTAMAFEKFPDFDRMVVYEADMLPPVDAFDHIATYGDEHDIVGSAYFKHHFPHDLQAYGQPNPPYFETLHRNVARQMIDNPGLYEVGGVAMGLTSISRRVLADWPGDVPMWTPAPPLVGHDLHFCNEARKQGYRVWLDTALGCGHISERPVGYADWDAVDDSPPVRKECESWMNRKTLRIAEPV
jgi:hypothetical protein